MSGIVILPRFTFDGTELYIPKSRIEAVDLREYLLYWDMIDFPCNNVIHFGSSTDDQFLIDAGVMIRTEIRFTSFSGNIGNALIRTQMEAFQRKNREEPGQWSLAQSANMLFMPSEFSQEKSTIEVELYKALPIPSENVSLADIMEFKDRRRDELQAFRIAMDQLYLDIIDSADIPRAKTVALSRLDRTLEDLHRVVNESWASKLFSSVKVELNIPNLVAAATVGATAGTVLDVSPSLGAAIGFAGALFKFEQSIRRVANGLPPELKDFAYLYRIEQELDT